MEANPTLCNSLQFLVTVVLICLREGFKYFSKKKVWEIVKFRLAPTQYFDPPKYLIRSTKRGRGSNPKSCQLRNFETFPNELRWCAVISEIKQAGAELCQALNTNCLCLCMCVSVLSLFKKRRYGF